VSVIVGVLFAWVLVGTLMFTKVVLFNGPFPAGDPEEQHLTVIEAIYVSSQIITTVGYGDAFPTTSSGKFVGTLTILCGIVVLAMPVGVIGSNFSNEYALRETEKRRRSKLQKQQLETARVEKEQDAVAEMEMKCGSQSLPRGEENAGADMRQKIIIDAEDIDSSWNATFPEHVHAWLSLNLRQFVSEFVHGAMNPSMKALPMGSRVTNLPMRLDQLSMRFNEACTSIVSYDDLSEFGIKECREKRKRWAGFVDKIWEYLAVVGAPEKPADQFENFELKAQLTTGMAPSASTVTPATSKGPSAASLKVAAQPTPSMKVVEEPAAAPAAPNCTPPKVGSLTPVASETPSPVPPQDPAPEVVVEAPESAPQSLPGMPERPERGSGPNGQADLDESQ